MTTIIKANYNNCQYLLSSCYNKLKDTDCLFVLFNTEYDGKGNVQNDCFNIIHHAINIGYHYINTIVCPSVITQEVSFLDNVTYIIWFCKNHDKMIFNKDSIREKHIWKDVEWGHRKQNYNPKGKDPGNVWIPTIDDGKAHITEHILLTEGEIIERLLRMTNTTKEDAEIIIIPKNTSRYSVMRTQPKSNVVDNNIPIGKVIFGTSENMDSIRASSIDTIITSPPYWDLKDYFKKGQIGQEDYRQYVSRMEKVWLNCYNKLKDTGSIWINVNIRIVNSKAILIPLDIINSCKKIGYFYKGIIVWHKSSGIPTNNKNIVDRFEFVLIFSKQESLKINLTSASEFCDYKNNDISGKAFWNINRKAGSVGKKYIHPAIYPNELVNRIITITTTQGDNILDPFLGSGTTLISALELKRNCIGYEFNEEFQELMESRFRKEITTTTRITFSKS